MLSLKRIFNVFVLLFAGTTSVCADKMTTATVYWDPQQKTVILKEGVVETEGDAYGYLNDTLTTTGWSVLEVHAGYGQTPVTDELTFFLAGYLEGFLTAQQMMDHYTNMYPQLITEPKILGPVQSFMEKQDSWTREQVKLNKDSDPLWRHAGFIVAQMDGLQAGAADWAKKQGKKPLSQFAVQFLNAVGDLLDLIPALVPDSNTPLRDFKLPGMGHCSALIKLLPGYENLLFAHSSWYTYAAMLRIYKHWDFRITDPNTATGKLSFSSYPGFLVSLDDFYLLGSGLMMTQTTNNVFNSSLFDSITPKSLLSWQRVRLAHSLAHSGEEWAKTFSMFNSGTYNNQYMVLDRSKVKLGVSVADGALTVVEQIPGLVEYSDQTQALRRDYKKDPYSKGDPCKTICCRGDLRTEKASPSGCYDTKVTDFHMAEKFSAEALNGPTTQGGLPPFTWGNFSSISHQGLPPYFNFTFVRMYPLLFTP
ncbi:phospholipase B-like 1 isoform 2-T2 [Tautogolabrus adspersus]